MIKKIDKALTKFEELAGHSVPVFLEMSSHDRTLAWYNYRIVNDSSNWSLSDSQYLVDIQELQKEQQRVQQENVFVTFTRPKLGITMVHNPIHGVQILAISEETQSLHPTLQVGMILKTINTEPVVDKTYSETIDLLKKTPQPNCSFGPQKSLPETKIFDEEESFGLSSSPKEPKETDSVMSLPELYDYTFNAVWRLSRVNGATHSKFLKMTEASAYADDDDYIANVISDLMNQGDTDTVLNFLAFLLYKRKIHEDFDAQNVDMLKIIESLNGKFLTQVRLRCDRVISGDEEHKRTYYRKIHVNGRTVMDYYFDNYADDLKDFRERDPHSTREWIKENYEKICRSNTFVRFFYTRM